MYAECIDDEKTTISVKHCLKFDWPLAFINNKGGLQQNMFSVFFYLGSIPCLEIDSISIQTFIVWVKYYISFHSKNIWYHLLYISLLHNLTHHSLWWNITCYCKLYNYYSNSYDLIEFSD